MRLGPRSYRLAGAAAAAVLLVGTETMAGSLASELQLTQITGGLSRPLAVRTAPGDSERLFVVEQAGTIRIVRNGTVLSTPFLDITANVESAGNEEGLLGLAFHPEYQSNGFFYVNYTTPPGTGADITRIERYAVSADPDVADAASAKTILEFAQPFNNHNGGDIHFGPDGYLYIATGDGGSSFDPDERAQDLTTLLGKLLRIDVDGIPPAEPNDLCGNNAAYGIPADNPFSGGSGDCDEIWALGLRNPFRFSFDRATGDLIIGDVGQSAMEEIDFQPAGVDGRNYGWDCREGTLDNGDISNLEPTCAGPGPLIDPVITYEHGVGTQAGTCSSVTGGYRYRGPAPALRGRYVYADFCSGALWTAAVTGGTWTPELFADTGLSISSFGEGPNGRLYLTDLGGGTLHVLEDPGLIFANTFGP